MYNNMAATHEQVEELNRCPAAESRLKGWKVIGVVVVLALVPLLVLGAMSFSMVDVGPSSSAFDVNNDMQVGRIVGGEIVPEGQYPFVVSLQTAFRTHFCGGSVLDSTHVLTAAQCCARIVGNFVVAGEHNLAVANPNEQRVQILQADIHPQYNAGTLSADVCVLTVESLTLNTAVQAVVLPPASERVSAGTNVTTMGWGTSSGGRPAAILMSGDLVSLSDANCQDAYGSTANMLCAVTPPGAAACQGDSGGPLVVTNDSRQVGVVSLGSGCADPRYPGLYAEVSYFVDWINSKIGASSSPPGVDCAGATTTKVTVIQDLARVQTLMASLGCDAGVVDTRCVDLLREYDQLVNLLTVIDAILNVCGN